MDEMLDVECPSCGEPYVLAIDPSAGHEQEYVEDCPVCCRPTLHRVRFDRDGRAWVQSRAE